MPKFDIVIGNPPYQENDGGHGASAKPLYNLFIEKIKDKINPEYLSFIIPSRWFAGGKGLDKFRKRMQTEFNIKIIKDFFNSKNIFKEVEVKGGICYFLSKREDKNKDVCKFISSDGIEWKNNLSKYDIIIREKMIDTILDKIYNNNTFVGLNNKVLSRKQFGLGSDFNNFVGLNKKVLPRKQFGIQSNFKEFSSKNTGIKCYSIGKKLNNIKKHNFTDKYNILNKWKVFSSKAQTPTYQMNPVVFMGKPNEISTETYLVLNTFDTELEANNFVKYVQTHFFEFMLKIKVITQNLSRDKYTFVPDQTDYTREYTDEYLYNKYDLTQEEVDFIESKFE